MASFLLASLCLILLPPSLCHFVRHWTALWRARRNNNCANRLAWPLLLSRRQWASDNYWPPIVQCEPIKVAGRPSKIARPEFGRHSGKRAAGRLASRTLSSQRAPPAFGMSYCQTGPPKVGSCPRIIGRPPRMAAHAPWRPLIRLGLSQLVSGEMLPPPPLRALKASGAKLNPIARDSNRRPASSPCPNLWQTKPFLSGRRKHARAPCPPALHVCCSCSAGERVTRATHTYSSPPITSKRDYHCCRRCL